MLAVAIVHYHLRTGGVTRVIQQASRELTRRGIPHVIIVGDAPATSANAELPIRIVDGLDYPESLVPRPIHGLLHDMRAAARSHLGSAAHRAIWHFHNHTVGLHTGITPIVRALATAGTPLVLHTHDFAEDQRPDNYRRTLGQQPFITAEHIRYICLNHRDLGNLTAAGINKRFVTIVPNSAPTIVPTARRSGPPLVLYPVRAIRRKNLGEICLLAAAAKAGGVDAHFAVGLAADEPEHISHHQAWREIISQLALPVELAVTDRLPAPGGSGSSFAAWIAASTHFVTTSTAEGFGLTFLEAQAHGRPLLGRDLPDITQDLRSKGAARGHFYRSIVISLTDRQRSAFEGDYAAHRKATAAAYGASTFTANSAPHDFAAFSYDLQTEIVAAVAKGQLSPRIDSAHGPELTDWLSDVLSADFSASPLPPAFSIASVVDEQLSLYESVSAQRSQCTTIPRTVVLDSFLR